MGESAGPHRSLFPAGCACVFLVVGFSLRASSFAAPRRCASGKTWGRCCAGFFACRTTGTASPLTVLCSPARREQRGGFPSFNRWLFVFRWVSLAAGSVVVTAWRCSHSGLPTTDGVSRAILGTLAALFPRLNLLYVCVPVFSTGRQWRCAGSDERQ